MTLMDAIEADPSRAAEYVEMLSATLKSEGK